MILRTRHTLPSPHRLPPAVAAASRAQASAAGFTLAEVLFSMAIFAFAVLILVGSLPNGLASMQSARARSAEVRILHHVTSVYQSELDRATAQSLPTVLQQLSREATLYFDAAGDPVRAVADPSVATAYGVRLRLLPPVSLPGESDLSPFLRRLEVVITPSWQDASAYNDATRRRLRILPLALRGPANPNAPTTGSTSPGTST